MTDILKTAIKKLEEGGFVTLNSSEALQVLKVLQYKEEIVELESRLKNCKSRLMELRSQALPKSFVLRIYAFDDQYEVRFHDLSAHECARFVVGKQEKNYQIFKKLEHQCSRNELLSNIFINNRTINL